MAKQGKIRTLLEYGAAKSIFAVIGSLPANQAISLGTVLGRIGYLLAGNLRRTAETNLKLAFPEMTAERRFEIIRGCFESLGRELGLFSKFSRSSKPLVLSVLEPQGLENLKNYKKNGRGRIFFTAHFGAWELTSYAVGLLEEPFSFLVRKIDNDMIERMVDRRRTSGGNQTLDKQSAARTMLRILRSGGSVGLLPDLNTLDDEAIFVDFFGVPAATNYLMAKIALRTQSPIIPVFAPWDAHRKKFLLQIQPAIQVELTGDEAEDVKRVTQKFTNVIEEQIRRYPEQWLWVHKRWKTRPPGHPSVY
ncbi:MAG TPA: lysophospholipid acyltransferase family protein [Pyrinomonadaceae bacterium]